MKDMEWLKTSDGNVYGRRFKSKDESHSAFLIGDSMGPKGFEPGMVLLFEQESLIFTAPETIRPRRVAVANSGTLVIGDFLANTGALHCRITIYNRNGQVTFDKSLRRNCTQVAISPEGNIAAFGTANPNNCVRVVATQTGEILKKIDGAGWFNEAKIDEVNRMMDVDGKYVVHW